LSHHESSPHASGGFIILLHEHHSGGFQYYDIFACPWNFGLTENVTQAWAKSSVKGFKNISPICGKCLLGLNMRFLVELPGSNRHCISPLTINAAVP
jgi:hypothetical protein